MLPTSTNRSQSADDPDQLRAEYASRQASKRPLPNSVAKAYEIVIQRCAAKDKKSL